MNLNFNKQTLIENENKKIGFCFKFCKFKKESEYSNKGNINKFFRRMVTASNDYFSNKNNYFFRNENEDLRLVAQKILGDNKNINNNIIYDMFKGNNAFRVYGFFEKNIFYILEFDLNHSSRPG